MQAGTLNKSEPHRIQRKRTKGWRMPPNTVYVGRPSRYSNPYPVLYGNYQRAVDNFERKIQLILSGKAGKKLQKQIQKVLEELRGKNLCCWCPLDKPCHADIWLELANK